MRRTILIIAVLVWIVATVIAAASEGFGDRTREVLIPIFTEQFDVEWQPAHDLHNLVRKSLHVLAYALFAVVVWFALPRPRRRPLTVLAVVLALAIVDESVQAFIPGRTARLSDVGLDVIGGAFAVGVLVVSRRFRRTGQDAGAEPHAT